MSVKREGFGDERGDDVGVEFSMEEGEVLPRLAHERALGGSDLELGQSLEVVEHGGCFSDFGSYVVCASVSGVWRSEVGMRRSCCSLPGFGNGWSAFGWDLKRWGACGGCLRV